MIPFALARVQVGGGNIPEPEQPSLALRSDSDPQGFADLPLEFERVAQRLGEREKPILGDGRQPLAEAILGDRMQAVCVDHTIDGHTILDTERNLAREVTDHPRHLRDDDIPTSLEAGGPGDDHNGPEARIALEFGPPDLAAPHRCERPSLRRLSG